jgi:hypothetical protein
LSMTLAIATLLREETRVMTVQEFSAVKAG